MTSRLRWAMLKVSGQLESGAFADALFFGELSLNGEVRPIRGILPMVIDAKARGAGVVFLPAENAPEAAYVEGIRVIPVATLAEVAEILKGGEAAHLCRGAALPAGCTAGGGVDFRAIKGQAQAKRAMEIAVAGGHNILLIGSPGAGKTMLARAIPSIMPELSFEEALEITKIHSIAGELRGEPMIASRPFRSPHHSASMAALIGGGSKRGRARSAWRTAACSFWTNWPEFRRETLEALRQPMEDGFVSVARAKQG